MLMEDCIQKFPTKDNFHSSVPNIILDSATTTVGVCVWDSMTIIGAIWQDHLSQMELN